MSASKIPGAKVLLMGDSGSGKTYSIRTFIPAGITPFVIFTEPGMETLSDLPAGTWHWKYIPTALEGWSSLLAMGETVNSVTFEALCKMTDKDKRKYTQWIEVIKTNNDFVCDCCDKHWGDVQTWKTDRVLVLDSLTGFSDMAFKLVIGGKVAKSMPDYQVAQEMVMKVLDAWLTGTDCWFVMTAHEEREADAATGIIRRFPKSIGKAIATDIPKNFSDIVETVRNGKQFSWDTAATNAATKARNLEISSQLPPSFATLIEAWKKKGGVIVPTVSPVSDTKLSTATAVKA